ncbi:sigma-70 family RNA polymerase sigma factor [Planctomycetales bacterium ZRK34]|nr:sigma-70 family RNA polymerase sigma factor [Planctomycetales bacterium ZRK34]
MPGADTVITMSQADRPFDEYDHGHEFSQELLKAQRHLFAFLLAAVGDAERADELLHATVATMWEKFNEFEPGTDFRAWGIQIARYKLLEAYRDQRRRARWLSLDAVDLVAAEFNRTPRQQELVREALGDCLGRLGERDRQIIHMRYEEGHDTRAVAARINRSLAATYKTLTRIHKQLLDCINIRMGDRFEGKA